MSPLYPNIYQENRRCDYHIEAPMGKAIKLDFSDFDMEGGTCDQDYLEVRSTICNCFSRVHLHVLFLS